MNEESAKMDLPRELAFLLERRSTKTLSEPGPTHAELELLLRAAMTSPDHGTLTPYRFVVVHGEARARFGEALGAAAYEARPDLGPSLVEKVRKKAFAAPTQIVLIASPREGMKIPEWEQTCSASCTGLAILLAAHALGLGAIWKSANALDGAPLQELFAMKPSERLLGWINVGRRDPTAFEPRPASDPTSVTRVLGASDLLPFEP